MRIERKIQLIEEVELRTKIYKCYVTMYVVIYTFLICSNTIHIYNVYTIYSKSIGYIHPVVLVDLFW